jgi:hypothetical protein
LISSVAKGLSGLGNAPVVPLLVSGGPPKLEGGEWKVDVGETDMLRVRETCLVKPLAHRPIFFASEGILKLSGNFRSSYQIRGERIAGRIGVCVQL